MFQIAFIRVAAFFVGSVLLSSVAIADSYPSRPIRLIVPWPAGNGQDIVTRIVSQKLSEILDQNIIVDNHGGASGTIGSLIASKAPSDGYTLVLGNASSHGSAAAVDPKLPYDPIDDFTPISLVAKNLLVIAANKDFPANTISDLVKYAKANPGKVSYGTPGINTAHMLVGELLKERAGINLVHVPYKGGNQVMIDMAGGHIQIAVSPMALAVKDYSAGRIKILAVVDQQRFNALPNVPALSEFYSGIDAITWCGFFGPKKLPAAIVEQLNTATLTALRSEGVKAAIDATGFKPIPSTPEELNVMAKQTIEQWQKIARSGTMKTTR